MDKLGIRQKKYSIAYFGLAILCFAYMVIFIAERNVLIAIVDAVEIFVYIAFGFRAKKSKRFSNIFATSCTVVCIHSAFHVLLLGPGYGFQYMFLGMIPAIFCFSYVNIKHIKRTMLYTVIDFAIFVLVTSLSYAVKTKYTGNIDIFTNFVMVVNIIVPFVASLAFMTEMVNEINADTGRLENQNSNLEQSANVDALTGLRNRRSLDFYMEKALTQAQEEGNDFSILMCDIDNFKRVNDTYGHECGDLVLQTIAEILTKTTRSDDIVFRWGGEELLILLNGRNFTACKVAERCRKAIEECEVVWKDTIVKITITIGGVSYYPGASADVMFERADENLYYGKEHGKNRIVL